MTEKQAIVVLCEAIHTYGRKCQMLVAVEEMAELTKEIMKRVNRDQCNNEELVEEVADVLIMMRQLQLILGEDTVNQAIGRKIIRLKRRISRSKSTAAT